MKNRKKIIIATSLFSIMFVSAWYVHGSSGRIVQLNDGEGAGMFELQQMEEDAVPIKEPFGPREYIKIGERADIINQ